VLLAPLPAVAPDSDRSPPLARAPLARGIACPLLPVAPSRRDPPESLRPEELPPAELAPPDDWPPPPEGALARPPPLGP
jgi:hypothetical protein